MRKILLLSMILSASVAPLPLAAQEGAPPSSALAVETAFCTGVSDRAPVGAAETFPADVGRIFLWTKVTGAPDGTTLTHVWSHEGKEVARVELKVNAGSWRTWSSKTIAPSRTGAWEVKILGSDGAVLKTVGFTVGGGATQ